MTVAEALGGAALFASALWLGWRLASRRRSLPCPAWLGWMVERDNPFTHTNRAASIIGHLDLRPGMAVLDAGCGPGRLTVPLARGVGPGGVVTALDMQEAMLDKVRHKAQAEGFGWIRCVRAGLGEGASGEGRYDRALLVTVLGEVPDPAGAMRELIAALKPGGLLSVTEVIFDPHFQPRRTVRGLALNAGFRETAFFGNRLAYTMLFQKPGQTAQDR